MAGTRTKDPLAPDIGRRIDQAREEARIESLAELGRQARIDLRLLHRYIGGEVMPGVSALMRIADVCHVSLDWLVRGSEHVPDALVEWLESPVGKGISDDARRLIRELPLHGYRPSARFYDLVLHAIREGLTLDEAVRAARATDENAGKPRE